MLESMTDPDVLITGERSKLPADVAALLDAAAPLPAEVIFFEKRYELPEMMRSLLIAIGLSCAAAIIIPFGVAEVFSRQPVTVTSRVDYLPLGFGCVVALGAWMMFLSLKTSWQLRNLQKLGHCTRRGIFLTSTALVQASESDTTVIPASRFRGLQGNKVKYLQNQLEKSNNLPGVLMNATPQQLQQAIMQWADIKRV